MRDFDLNSEIASDARDAAIEEMKKDKHFYRMDEVLENMKSCGLDRRAPKLFKKIENEYDDWIKESIAQMADEKEYNKDPYAYLGLSRSMFL